MKRRSQKGLSLIELIVAFTILALLCSMAVPLARYKVKRDRERDLRWALHEIRTAIDHYKDDADAGKLGPQKMDTMGYPETLEVLVEGASDESEYVLMGRSRASPMSMRRARSSSRRSIS